MKATQINRTTLLRKGPLTAVILGLLLALLLLLPALAQDPAPDETDWPAGDTQSDQRAPEGIVHEWPLEIGVEIVADYPGTGSDLPNAINNGYGIYNTLRGAGWCNSSWNDCYIWTNGNAWEQDFKRHDLGGTNNNWADNVDLVFYEGHGWPGGFTFKTATGGGTHDDSYLTYSDARQAWGDKDAEWVALLSCSVLADSHEADWANTMDGLHLIMGFKTTAYDVHGFAKRFAQHINSGRNMTSSWFKACDQKQPQGVKAKVLAEEKKYFFESKNWQYSDPSPDNVYWWWWHTCSGAPARQVDVAALDTMPVFKTPALSLAEAQKEWGELSTAFAVTPTQRSVSRIEENDFYVVEVEGRELEMDTSSGLFYYIDHNKLFSETATLRRSPEQIISAADAITIADKFLTDNGLNPADAEFYDVAADTLAATNAPGRSAGLRLGEATVLSETTTSMLVMYSRILTFSQGRMPDGSQNVVSMSVMGPGAKLKVYVDPSGGQARVSSRNSEGVLANGAIMGAQGGWRSLQSPSQRSPQTVKVLDYNTQLLPIFQNLEPDVALGNVPFDNPTSKKVLSYTLSYWEESSGIGQDQLYPAYALYARYERTSLTDTVVSTDYTYIPANETFMRPLARIESTSDLSQNFTPGQVVTMTALDASKTLSASGIITGLDFVLGSGDYAYAWYLNEITATNKLGSGRNMVYTTTIPGAPKSSPDVQTIILQVTDIGTSRTSQNIAARPITVIPPTYTLTVNVVGSGTVTPTAGTHNYITGSVVSLAAVPDADWFFAGWSGDLSIGSAQFPEYPLVMNRDRAITATFTTGEVTVLDPNTPTNIPPESAGSVTVTIEIPAGAVTDTMTLVYTTQETSASPPSGFQFVGKTFILDIAADGVLQSGFHFEKPITITLQYRDEDVVGLKENELGLRYWNGSVWASDGISCQVPAKNTLVCAITHLTEFALMGEEAGAEIYLPLILK